MQREPRVLPPLVPSAVRPRFAAGAAAEASPPVSPVASYLDPARLETVPKSWLPNPAGFEGHLV